jgi:hypothetical protein
LVFKVDQGWAPLCAFLSAFRSRRPEFPNLNDRAHVKKAIQGVINGTYVTLAGYAAVTALLLYGAHRLLQ